MTTSSLCTSAILIVGLVAAAPACKKDEPAAPPGSPPAFEESSAPKQTPPAQAQPNPSPGSDPYAAQQGGGQPELNTEAPQAEISQEQLERFAKAYDKVQGVQRDLSSKLSQAKEPKQVEAVQREAMEAMESEVRAVGLSVAEFTAIAQQVEQSPELQERLGAVRPAETANP